MIPIHKITGRLSNQMFEFAALYAYCRANNIHIFVQDEKYFERYKDEIRALYSHDITPNSINRVAIHRRLTDYVKNDFYADLGHHEHEKLADNYFMRAMAMFPNEKFTVFSDDIETAKQEPMFQGDQFEFSEDRNEVEDMNYAACHKSHIISNSSYGWWFAWLGKHKDQIVIAPKKWFANPENEKYIGIPEKWIRI